MSVSSEDRPGDTRCKLVGDHGPDRHTGVEQLALWPSTQHPDLEQSVVHGI